MFGLMMLVVFALIMCRIATRAIGLTERSHRHRMRAAVRRGEPLPVEKPALPPEAPVETPLEKLQREFATGSMTVDQYERELNRLYGIRG